MDKKELLSQIESQHSIFTALSDKIWDTPELSLKEHQSMAAYVELLTKLGFTVETGLAGVETAFSGSYGSGKPIIGFLGEFDALSGLSQKSGVTHKEALASGGCGHGCGHNLLGAGALAAANAVKEYLAEKGEGSGTVIFYGCPGEEGNAGKAFMAQKELFSHLDAAVTWHPSDVNEVVTGSCLASYQLLYQFSGTAAHAAGCPQMGRSALDALELMNVGVQFLREHIGPHDGLHYAILDNGGSSPNVVQPTASVLYMLRSDNVPNIRRLAERVHKVAQGAAMMTETEVSWKFIDGTADVLPNATLEKLAYENFAATELPTYSEAELAFAAALRKTYTVEQLPGFATEFDSEIEDFVREKSGNGSKVINDFLVPYYHSRMISAGSSDVGDVSHQTPTVQVHTVTLPAGTPGHSWQTVSAGKSSIAHKGLLLAAKVMAATAFDLFEQPEVLASAKAEFKKVNRHGYVCPIEEGTTPTPVE